MARTTARTARASRVALALALCLAAAAPARSTGGAELALPLAVKRVRINVGPHTSPLLPAAARGDVAVVAVEPNVGVAHALREAYQRGRFAGRFFVVAAALGGGGARGGSVGSLRYYNAGGMSSSLAEAARPGSGFADRARNGPGARFGPGEGGVDFVPVLSLEAVLRAVPRRVDVELVKIDAQGFDLEIVKGASRQTLRRVRKIVAETYLPGVAEARYKGVRNELQRDWVPYMRSVGFELQNPTDRVGAEYDAVWVRK